MRTPIAIAVACIAAFFSVEAAPTTCTKTYKVVAGDTVCTISVLFMNSILTLFCIYSVTILLTKSVFPLIS
jgi:hypothetical protein